MQTLKRIDRSSTLPSDTRAEAEKAVDHARRLLADASQGLVFEPVEHRYTLGEREMTSVSVMIKQFAPFDSEKVAAGCSKNPKHEHYGKSVEEILAIWDDKKNAAAAAGTEVHSFGEACGLFWEGREDEIEEKYRSRITPEGFVAESPKEEAMVKWWSSLDPDRYIIVAAEGRIVNPILGYAGTFDLLLYDITDKVFLLKDYKTNEDLFKWYGSYMKAPLSVLKNSDIGKYTMQQNMYGIQLENIGIPTSSMHLIWLRQDGGFEEVRLEDRYRKIITYALNDLKKNGIQNIH